MNRHCDCQHQDLLARLLTAATDTVSDGIDQLDGSAILKLVGRLDNGSRLSLRIDLAPTFEATILLRDEAGDEPITSIYLLPAPQETAH